MTPQPLPQGVPGDESVELRKQLPVSAAGHLGIDPILDRVQVGLVEPRCFGVETRASPYISQRRPAPQAKRLREQASRTRGVAAARLGAGALEEREEAVSVDELGRDGQTVGAIDELDDRRGVSVPEQLADARGPDLQRPPRPIGVELRPELLDEPVDADSVAVVEDEHRQERPLLRRRRRDVDAVDLHAEGPEEPERAQHFPSM